MPHEQRGTSYLACSRKLWFVWAGCLDLTCTYVAPHHCRLFRKKKATGPAIDAAYEIGSKIGEGQFAEVFHGKPFGSDVSTPSGSRDSPSRSQRIFTTSTGALKHVPDVVAIKSIDKTKVGDKSDLEREVEIMRSIAGHPNILQLYETFEEPARLHLVLELLTGGNLFDRIVDKGYFSEAEAAGIIAPLCSALDHMHGMMIVHRDVKPEK